MRARGPAFSQSWRSACLGDRPRAQGLRRALDLPLGVRGVGRGCSLPGEIDTVVGVR